MFDVVNVLVEKKMKTKFRKVFSEKVEYLEQNMLNCCNPQKFGIYESKFKMVHYTLPDKYLNPIVSKDKEDGDDG